MFNPEQEDKRHCPDQLRRSRLQFKQNQFDKQENPAEEHCSRSEGEGRDKNPGDDGEKR